MSLWDYSEAVAACALAYLNREKAHGFLALPAIGQALHLDKDSLLPVLTQLEEEGSVESCIWPYESQPYPHFRITSLGRCFTQRNQQQWLEDRMLLDSFLLDEVDATAPAYEAQTTNMSQVGG